MTIFIPTPLRPFAGGQDAVEVNAATITEALRYLPAKEGTSVTKNDTLSIIPSIAGG